jgi:3-dehydroquinate dehydratase type I
MSLCIPIQARSLLELKLKANKAAKYSDLIEVWIDHLPPNIEPKTLVDVVNKPLIIVNRPKRGKGLWQGTEKNRVERLKKFIIPGVQYIDIEIDTNPKLIKDLIKHTHSKKKSPEIIISYHNFSSTPSEKALWDKVQKSFKLGADIVKIATFAKTLHDNIRLFNLLEKAKKQNKKLIVVGMGKNGKISRIQGEMLGSKITFVALNGSTKSAPGQLTYEKYKKFATLIKTL